MIRIPRDDRLPMIFYRSEMCWRDFEPQDELFDRAIYLGQGCWERLHTIEEKEALQILEAWGCRSAQESE